MPAIFKHNTPCWNKNITRTNVLNGQDNDAPGAPKKSQRIGEAMKKLSIFCACIAVLMPSLAKAEQSVPRFQLVRINDTTALLVDGDTGNAWEWDQSVDNRLMEQKKGASIQGFDFLAKYHLLQPPDTQPQWKPVIFVGNNPALKK